MSGASVQHDGERLAVSGELDFDSARQVLAEVAPAIESTATTVIDLSGVSRSNSAGLALMIEWLGIARRHGHELRFEHVPEGLTQLARVCQVESLVST